MVLNVRKGLTFDDVLLVPKYSTIDSRKNIDVSVDLGKGVKLSIPIISANMKNITELNMALKIAEMGGLAILHRFYDNPLHDQLSVFYEVIKVNPKYINHVGVSIGVQDSDFEQVCEFVQHGIKIICLDIAHAHSAAAGEMVSKIKANYPNVLLIAGNVSTAEAFTFLAKAGADVIKSGVGAGSICTTRIETGNGVPQLTALSECYQVMDRIFPNVKIIADGGIKAAGDLTKCLCFSHAVMLGNLLAGTDEAPGETTYIDGKSYKSYNGSSTFKKDHIEGVSALVPIKGPVENVINKLLQGLKSGCSYQGVDNLQDLKEYPEFISVTNAGLIESRAHDVIVVK